MGGKGDRKDRCFGEGGVKMRKAWVNKSYHWIPLAKRRPRVKRPIFIFTENKEKAT